MVFLFSFWQERLYRMVFSSGVGENFAGLNIIGMGMPWFLVCLFLARLLFNYIKISFDGAQIPIVYLMFTVIGINTRDLPFSLDIVFAIQLLLYFGYWLSERKYTESGFNWRVAIISACLWIGTLYMTFPDPIQKTYMELAVRRYPMFPLCFICASAGTVFICEVSKLFTKIPVARKATAFLGRISLFILVVHCMDYTYEYLWRISGHEFVSASRRVIIDIVVSVTVFLLAHIASSVVKNYKEKLKQ